MLSGRAARRSLSRDLRRRGAGWTRSWRKGRGTGDPLAPRVDAEMQRPRVRTPYPAITPKPVKRAE